MEWNKYGIRASSRCVLGPLPRISVWAGHRGPLLVDDPRTIRPRGSGTEGRSSQAERTVFRESHLDPSLGLGPMVVYIDGRNNLGLQVTEYMTLFFLFV